MSEPQVRCSSCGAAILQSTYQTNNGLCGTCHRQQYGRRATPVHSIHEAILAGDFARATELLKKHGPIRPKNFYSTLRCAARESNIPALQFLAESVLDLTTLPETVTPLDVAVEAGGMPTIRWLLDHGVDVNQGRSMSLHTAVREGNLEVVQLLVEAGADVNATGPQPPLGPLDLAVTLGRSQIADFLRSRGAVEHGPLPRLHPIVDLTSAASVGDTIDLRADVAEFETLMDRGVSAFVGSQNVDPNVLITRIDIRFTLTSAEVPIIDGFFDTHPRGEADTGTSKTFPWFEALCHHWAIMNGVLDGLTLTVRTADGSYTVRDEESLNAAVGPFFVALLKSTRDRGAFGRLPLAKQCYLGVAESEGAFGWPAWKDRGPENMV
jgi:hypothetical protein